MHIEVRQDRHCKKKKNQIRNVKNTLERFSKNEEVKDKEIKIMRLIEIKNQLKNSNIKLIDFLEE